MNKVYKLLTLVLSALLFVGFSFSEAKAQGTFDCGWTSVAGSPAACRALNMSCDSGYEANYVLCGNLTTQGRSACEAQTNVDCVETGMGVLAAPGSAAPVSQVWYDQHNILEWYVKVFDDSSTPANEVFGERYTAAQVQWVLFSLPAVTLNQILGRDVMVCMTKGIGTGDISSCVDVVTEKLKDLANPFALNTKESTRLATDDKQYWLKFFASKPISGIGYIINKSSDLHLIPTAQAQGFGYNEGANPVLNLWKAVRNVSFMLLVIVTIVFSFLIMFRVKLSPQVVVSIQSALPKIVIAMILITFSYAIAGFLIDLMYVVIGLISTLLASVTPAVTNIRNPIELFDQFTDGQTALGLTWFYVFYFLFATLRSIASTSWLLGLLAFLFVFILFFVVLFNGFKIIWLTIKTFATLLLSIVFGPMQILLGAVSASTGFGKWVAGIISNLAIFPIIGVMFFLSYYLLSQASSGLIVSIKYPFGIITTSPSSGLASSGWEPPLSFGTDGASFLWLMASYAVFAMIPKAGEIAKSMFAGGKFSAGTAIGESLTGGAAPLTAGFGKIWGAYDKAKTDAYVERIKKAGLMGGTLEQAKSFFPRKGKGGV